MDVNQPQISGSDQASRILNVHCDGAARGNPGPAGAGVIIYDQQGNVLREMTKYLGRTTNNQAEYAALVMGLKTAQELAPDEIHVKLDSELIVKQINGEYRVRNMALKPFFEEVSKLLKTFKRYTISHVPREQNRMADMLANAAIDRHL